jgi:NAD-dependent SIR2 family protein deacetylase
VADRDLDALVRRVRAWIDDARRVVVLTGAGISTESGIPDFRGPQGCGPGILAGSSRRSCGGILKSATISFGQGLVAEDLARAQQAARLCDLLLTVGTKLSVWPIAGVVPLAKESGARVVIINAEPTEMDQLADAVLRGSISELLPGLVAGR